MLQKQAQKRVHAKASDVTAEDSDGDQENDSGLEKKKDLKRTDETPPAIGGGKAETPAGPVADPTTQAAGPPVPPTPLPIVTAGLPIAAHTSGPDVPSDPTAAKVIAPGASGGGGAAGPPSSGTGGPPTIYSAAAPGFTEAKGWSALGIAFRCEKLDAKSFAPFPIFTPGSQYNYTIRYDGITYRHSLLAFMAPDLARQVKLGGLPWETYVEAVGLMISLELTDDFDMVQSSNGKFKCVVDRLGREVIQSLGDNVERAVLGLTDDWTAIKQVTLKDLADLSFARPSLTTRMYANYTVPPPRGATIAASTGRRLAGCFLDGTTLEIIRAGLTDSSSRWDTPAVHQVTFNGFGFQVTQPANMYDWRATGNRQEFVRYRSGQVRHMLAPARGPDPFIMPDEYTLVISATAREFNQLFPTYQSVGIPFETTEGITKVVQSSDYVESLFKGVPEYERGAALTALGQMTNAFDCKFNLENTFDVKAPATAFPIMLALLMIYPGYLAQQTGVLVMTILMNFGTFQGGLAAGGMTVLEIAAARPQREILKPNIQMRSKEGAVYRMGQLMWDVVTWACDPARYRHVLVSSTIGRRRQPVPAPLFQQLVATGVVNGGGFLNPLSLAVDLAATLFSEYQYIGIERMDEAVNRFMPLWAELTGGNAQRLSVSTIARSQYFSSTMLTFYLSMLALSRFPTYGMSPQLAYKERRIEINAAALASVYYTGDALGKAVSSGSGITKAVASIVNSITYANYRVQLGTEGTLTQLQRWIFAGVQRYGGLRQRMTITPEAYTALMENWIWRRWDKAKATAPLLKMVDECVEGYYLALESRVEHPAFVRGFRLQPGETVADLGLLFGTKPLEDLFYPDGAVRIRRRVARTDHVVPPHNALLKTLGPFDVPGELRAMNYGDPDWMFYGRETNVGFACALAANGDDVFEFETVGDLTAPVVLDSDLPAISLEDEVSQQAVSQISMRAGVSVSGTLIESQAGGAIGTLDVGTIIKGCYREGPDGRCDRIYTGLTAVYHSYLSLGRDGLVKEAKAVSETPADMLPFVTVPGGVGGGRGFASIMPNTDVVIGDGGKAAPTPPKAFPVIAANLTVTEIVPKIDVGVPMGATSRHMVTVGATMSDGGAQVQLVEPIGLECFWRAAMEYKELILDETLNGVRR